MLSDRLRQLAIQSGMSQSELARRSRISQATVSRFLRAEQSLSMDAAERLAWACGSRVQLEPRRGK